MLQRTKKSQTENNIGTVELLGFENLEIFEKPRFLWSLCIVVLQSLQFHLGDLKRKNIFVSELKECLFFRCRTHKGTLLKIFQMQLRLLSIFWA